MSDISKLAKSCIENDGRYRLTMMKDKENYCPFPNIGCPYLDKDRFTTKSTNQGIYYWGCDYKKNGE